MGELHSINFLRKADINREDFSVVAKSRRRLPIACIYIDTKMLMVGAEEKRGIS